MTQALAYIPNAKPIPEPPRLRLTPRTPTVREGPPPRSPSAAIGAPLPQDPSPKTQVSSPPQPEPSLERLLTLYLDPQLTIADIAFTLGLSIPHTLQLVRRQEFLDALWVYSHEHEKRANYLACCNIDTAARTFVRLATCDKPETARKAAGAIVRMHAETKPEKVSPETRLKAAATLLKATPPLAPSPRNPDRKGGGSRTRNQRRTVDRRTQRLAEELGIAPENAAATAVTLERRLQEIEALKARVSTPSKPRSGDRSEARGGSPWKTSVLQPA